MGSVFVGASGRSVLIYRKRYLSISETFVADHILNLRRWRPVPVYEDRVEGGIAVEGYPGQPIFAGDAGMLDRGRLLYLGRNRELEALVERERPSLIHGHFLPNTARLAAFAQRLGLPLVVTAHGYDATIWPKAPRSPGQYLRRSMLRRLSAGAAAIVCVSDFIRGELESRGYPPGKLHVIPLGLRVDAFRPGPDVAARRGVAFAGRLVEKKGVDLLIEAWGQLPAALRGVPLTIVGDGPRRQRLEARAAELGVPAKFLGAQPRDQVLAVMRQARVFAFPSIRAASGDAEGMGIVAMEAQALGTPVAAFDGCTGPEVIADGRSGLLARAGDPADLARALARILTDDDLARRLSAEGPKVVRERFDLARSIARLEDLYDSVAARQGLSSNV
jgi:glycosyltransferase involved in cell wall biosynthesis